MWRFWIIHVIATAIQFWVLWQMYVNDLPTNDAIGLNTMLWTLILFPVVVISVLGSVVATTLIIYFSNKDSFSRVLTNWRDAVTSVLVIDGIASILVFIVFWVFLRFV